MSVEYQRICFFSKAPVEDGFSGNDDWNFQDNPLAASACRIRMILRSGKPRIEKLSVGRINVTEFNCYAFARSADDMACRRQLSTLICDLQDEACPQGKCRVGLDEATGRAQCFDATYTPYSRWVRQFHGSTKVIARPSPAFRLD